MARTVAKYTRVYVNGLDMSGYTRTVGPLGWSFEEARDRVVGNEVDGYLPNQCMITAGPLSAAFDNTVDVGPHVNFNAPGLRTLLVALGFGAAPAAGDPAFCGQFEQLKYEASPAEAAVVSFADMALAPSQAAVAAEHYEIPWGLLLHAKGEETAANAAAGVDGGAASALGGFMMYQVFEGDGTATLKVQDAATNSDGSFSDLVSSGEINFAGGESGVVALARNATVERYLRWQLALNSATAVNFALAFVRAYH